ncbi:MAG: hypothetical protein QOE01_8 [Actinomycetota bacterium]|jgi:hypothetical protein|nr:hypothetical protein [Actinomycetota bacterium]
MTPLIVIVALLLALDLLGWRFGADSRRSGGWTFRDDDAAQAASPSGRTTPSGRTSS